MPKIEWFGFRPRLAVFWAGSVPSDDVAAYESMVAGFVQRWQPCGPEECNLVQCLADIHWRSQRIPVLEYGIFATGELEFAGHLPTKQIS